MDMDRKERTSQKVEELFHQPAAGEAGTDPEFMQILQRYIFGDLCYTGSLDNRMRELVTITVLTVIQTLPQLKAHLAACLDVGCTPVELREAVYQCAPLIGFPRTLNAIAVLNEVLTASGVSLPLPKQGTLTDDEERYERGLAMQEPVYDAALRDCCAWLPKPFDEALPRFLTEFVLGDLQTRSGLDRRTRELLTVVALAALGGAEGQLKNYVARARKSGSTKEEVVCALVHAGAYMGTTRLFNALNAVRTELEA